MAVVNRLFAQSYSAYTTSNYLCAMQRTEQERIRRESLAALRALGIEPYPAAEFTVTHRSKRLAAEFKDGLAVTLAGRIMSRRIMGKASFAEIQDSEGMPSLSWISANEALPMMRRLMMRPARVTARPSLNSAANRLERWVTVNSAAGYGSIPRARNAARDSRRMRSCSVRCMAQR